jgi:hypothetical protein
LQFSIFLILFFVWNKRCYLKCLFFRQEKQNKNSQNKKYCLDLNEEHAPLTNHLNIDFIGESEFDNNCKNNSENNSYSNLSKAELQEKEAKILRFGIDYCRASPNIHLKTKSILNTGWRNTKFHFDVDLELANSFSYKIENVIFIKI